MSRNIKIVLQRITHNAPERKDCIDGKKWGEKLQSH